MQYLHVNIYMFLRRTL